MISNFPLMIIMLVVYNGIAFGLGVDAANWGAEIYSVGMLSGARWSLSMGDLVIAAGLFLLFFEILKSTRIGARSIVDHLLSTIVFIGFLVEFLLVQVAATGVFVTLMLMTLIDVMAGFSVSIRTATRDVAFGRGGEL